MEGEQTTNPDTSQSQPITPKEIPIEHPKEVVVDKPQIQPELKDTSEIEKHTKPKVIAKDSSWTNADTISLIGVIVNIILAGLTYFLFKEATNANNVATDALKTTQESVKEAKRANDISIANLKLAQDNFASSEFTSKENLGLAKQSLQAQVSSIKETQKQFEVANMPYLQCSNFQFGSLTSNEPVEILYTIENSGNYTAKIVGRKLSWIARLISSNAPLKYTDDSKFNNNFTAYINKERPRIERFTAKEMLTEEKINIIMNGMAEVVFFGEITYQNEINGKKRLYSFAVKINPPPNIDYKIIYNENKDIK